MLQEKAGGPGPLPLAYLIGVSSRKFRVILYLAATVRVYFRKLWVYFRKLWVFCDKFNIFLVCKLCLRKVIHGIGFTLYLFFIQWNACLHMTCVGHVRGNFNDYFSWNNGMCSQLILRANSLKYVPQLFFMLTCLSANAMQCSVKIVSELFLGRQLISFDKKNSLRKNRIVLQHAR